MQICFEFKRHLSLRTAVALLCAQLAAQSAVASPLFTGFTQGDLVVSTVSSTSTVGALDTAGPIGLQQFQIGAGGKSITANGSLVLPQTNRGSNLAISGEYGSASEGFLQLSGNGQYLTIMGYGVNANAFNNAPLSTYGTKALGQSTSLTPANQTGPIVSTVSRVVALIGANGGVNTTTALTGIYNQNNPRSAYTVNGTSFYTSGQGTSGSTTQGIYYAGLGSTIGTPILNTQGDTRDVQVVNGVLTYSQDFGAKGGLSQGYVATLTNGTNSPPANSSNLTRTVLTPSGNDASSGSGLNLKNSFDNGYYTTVPGSMPAIYLTKSGSNGNTVNSARDGNFVYASPEQFFYANATTLYVTDSGEPKSGSADKAGLGDGGLQKYTLDTKTGLWTMDYTLSAGLNLVDNATANSATPTAPGVTGLFGLTGLVVGNNVELFATSYGLNELSPSYLYEITDVLGDTSSASVSGETFTVLEAAASGSTIRGVSFAPVGASALTPVPEPYTAYLFVAGLAALFVARRNKGASV